MANMSVHRNVSRRGSPAPARRWRRRLVGAAVVAIAGVTIAYGESWLLRSAPAGSIEFAASDGLARVLDRELSVN